MADESKVSIARSLALNSLIKIDKGGFSNIIISDVIKNNPLSANDRSLFSVLVKGVTERRLTLDYVISAFSSIPIGKLDPDTVNILRMGLYQLTYMDSVPMYAVVNESVSLARKRSKGFVNAILRSFIRREGRYELPKDPIERMSVELSVSHSLCRRLFDVYGEERCRSILAAFLGADRMDICVNTLLTSREDMIKRIRESGYEAVEGRLSHMCVKTNAPYSYLADAFLGKFLPMDEASQLCAIALGASEGELLIDACAAPGSKSYASAILMNNKGRILSSDLHASKLSLIENGARTLGIDIISVRCADARNDDPKLVGSADKVLCDVPCSGIGVMGGKPEIKYKDLSDVASLPKIQYDILSN